MMPEYQITRESEARATTCRVCGEDWEDSDICEDCVDREYDDALKAEEDYADDMSDQRRENGAAQQDRIDWFRNEY